MAQQRLAQGLVASMIAVVALAVGSVAGAVGNPDYTAPPPSTPVVQPLPAVIQRAQNVPASPSVPATNRSRMPVTGSDLVQLFAMGTVLVAGGAGLLTVRRGHGV